MEVTLKAASLRLLTKLSGELIIDCKKIIIIDPSKIKTKPVICLSLKKTNKSPLVNFIYAKNGILPVAIATEIVDQLFEEMFALEGYRLEVDLVQCHIKTPDGAQISFEVDSFRRYCLLEGLDDIGITLKSKDEIRAFEQTHRENNPWLFEDIQL